MDNMDLAKKCESLEDRISNLRVTIKQLGNEVNDKDVEINKLKQELQETQQSKLGLSLQLDKALEDIKFLKQTKELKVCEVSEISNVLNQVGKALSDMEIALRNNTNEHSNSELGRAGRQMRIDEERINELLLKIDSLTEDNHEQYTTINRQELELERYKRKLYELQQEQGNTLQLSEDLKVAQYTLSQREDDISELKDNLAEWAEYHRATIDKYKLGVLLSILVNVTLILMLIIKW